MIIDHTPQFAISNTWWGSSYTGVGKSLGMGCQWLPETYDMKHISKNYQTYREKCLIVDLSLHLKKIWKTIQQKKIPRLTQSMRRAMYCGAGRWTGFLYFTPSFKDQTWTHCLAQDHNMNMAVLYTCRQDKCDLTRQMWLIWYQGNVVQNFHLPKVLKFSSSWHGGTALFAALLTHSAIDQVDPVQIRAKDTDQSSSFTPPKKSVTQNTKYTCWRSQPHAQPTNRWNPHPLATSPPKHLLSNRLHFFQLFLYCQKVSFVANISRR